MESFFGDGKILIGVVIGILVHYLGTHFTSITDRLFSKLSKKCEVAAKAFLANDLKHLDELRQDSNAQIITAIDELRSWLIGMPMMIISIAMWIVTYLEIKAHHELSYGNIALALFPTLFAIKYCNRGC
jgi:hypothetical protein